MKCEYCDRELENGVLVCPYCGGKVESKTEISSNSTDINNIPNEKVTKKSSKKGLYIALGIVCAIVLVVSVIFIVNLLTKTKDKQIDTTYQFDYENVAYYINDDEVIIDNGESVTTTTTKKTTKKITTSMVTTASIPVTTTRTTAARSTTTTRPISTNSSNNTSTSSTILTTRSSVIKTTTSSPTMPSSSTTTSTIPSTTSTTTTSTSTTSTSTTTTSTSISTSTTSTSTTTSQNNPSKPISRTLLIYMIGSNLESENASASRDIQEMATANMDDYTDVFIYTGGSKEWHISTISAESNTIYYVRDGYLYPVADIGNKNMGDANTLAEFINCVDSITASDRYDLVLWDHGSGPIWGYGNDEKTGDNLFLAEIVNALEKTNFKGDRKFEFIGFDACLMASVEIGYYLRNYADYLLASEELEIGWGWDYTVLEGLAALETVDFAKKIIDGFAESNYTYMEFFPNTAYTLSLIDLSKMNNVVKSINETFKRATKNLNTDYENMAYLRLNTLEFGMMQQGASYDLVDIYSYADAASYDDLKKSVKDSVIYSNSNLKNAHGLTMYFPYTSSEELTRDWLTNMYSTFTDFKDYYEFLTAFSDIRYSDNKRVNLDISETNGQFRASSNQLLLPVTNEEKRNIARSYYIIFEKCEDGNYMPVFRGNDLTLQGNNLVANYNKKILNIIENNDVGTTPIYESKTTNHGTLYLGVAVLMDFEEDLKVDSGYVKFFIKDDDVTFQGITPFDDEADENRINAENKQEWQLEDWQFIHFGNYRYNILDKNGHYTKDWQSLETHYMFEVSPKKNKVEFKMNDIQPDKEYFAVINVVDFQGNVSSTDLIPIK